VAYVSKKAISAGALISVACEDIIMKEKTRIGDCAPIALGGKLEGVNREKIETDIRAAFVTSAKANNYPEALLRAMVTQQIEVYKVINKSTGEGEFFESTRMPQDPNEYNLEKKELIVSKDELLTLTASEALTYGRARAVVPNQQGALDFLSERDRVVFSGKLKILKTNWSEEMVRKINHPAVMSILIMIALLGVYIEFNTPGVGLPGLVAVICFTIIIGSKYLVGLANWAEVAIFIIGVILLMIEIFIIPGFGITGILGIILMVGGLFGMLIRNGWDEVPWPRTEFDWYLFSQSILGLAIGFFGFIVLAWALTKYLPKFEFMSGLILVPATPKKGDEFEISMTVPPESKIGTIQVGDIGEVTSILRPSGKARFDEAVVDCVAEADFLDKGCKVEIIEIHGNKVIVRSVKDQEQE
jgi:membrane-bound serine protease (ClpP class)